MRSTIAVTMSMAVLLATRSVAEPWPAPKAPVIPGTDGYVVIPHAAVPPDKARTYRAVFDATQAAGKPTDVLPALNMVGSELNALGVAGVPRANAKFVVVFHGDAIDGILTDQSYKAKFGVSNPNLQVLSDLEAAGVALFVCGQNLAFAHIDPATLAPDVKVSADALIVLMTYQNDGYALLGF